MAKIEVKQIKSSIGTKPRQKATLVALGLRGINCSRVHEENSVIMGMIRKVNHLVEVKKVD